MKTFESSAGFGGQTNGVSSMDSEMAMDVGLGSVSKAMALEKEPGCPAESKRVVEALPNV